MKLEFKSYQEEFGIECCRVPIQYDFNSFRPSRFIRISVRTQSASTWFITYSGRIEALTISRNEKEKRMKRKRKRKEIRCGEKNIRRRKLFFQRKSYFQWRLFSKIRNIEWVLTILDILTSGSYRHHRPIWCLHYQAHSYLVLDLVP